MKKTFLSVVVAMAAISPSLTYADQAIERDFKNQVKNEIISVCGKPETGQMTGESRTEFKACARKVLEVKREEIKQRLQDKKTGAQEQRSERRDTMQDQRSEHRDSAQQKGTKRHKGVKDK